nr:GH25 family lysozyme [Nocardioides thalensis]
MTATPPPRSSKERVRHLGIDASHHQGTIGWEAVANDGISFAYLKATEGATFTDPMFATNARQAADLGIEVAGYHYFSLCTPGADQAQHFVSVIEDAPSGWLPPAVDVELLGSCSTPPPREALLAEIKTFLEVVERHTGQRPVVYLFPDFEEEYGAAAELSGYRQWVRDLDGRPERDWWVWQQTDSGSVDGVDGPVDVNILFRREVVAR